MAINVRNLIYMYIYDFFLWWLENHVIEMLYTNKYGKSKIHFINEGERENYNYMGERLIQASRLTSSFPLFINWPEHKVLVFLTAKLANMFWFKLIQEIFQVDELLMKFWISPENFIIVSHKMTSHRLFECSDSYTIESQWTWEKPEEGWEQQKIQI